MLASRRVFLAGTAGILMPFPLRTEPASGVIASLEASLGGRVGFSARDTGSGRELHFRADERFAMCSTFKTALAAAVLTRIEQGELARTEILHFDPAALLPTSPITAVHSDGRVDVLAACEAIVSYSDNTAANLLLQRIGGPEALTRYFRQIGDNVSRLDRYELSLNSNADGDPRDTTTPRAMLGTLQRLLLGDALDGASRELLTGWMVNEQNGKARMRAGLPPDWRIANKPGTSLNGATNDIAVAWPPKGAPLVLSAFVNAPHAEPAKRQRAIAQLAQFAMQRLLN